MSEQETHGVCDFRREPAAASMSSNGSVAFKGSSNPSVAAQHKHKGKSKGKNKSKGKSKSESKSG